MLTKVRRPLFAVVGQLTQRKWQSQFPRLSLSSLSVAGRGFAYISYQGGLI